MGAEGGKPGPLGLCDITSLGSPCLALLPQGRASELWRGSQLWCSAVNKGPQIPMYLQPKLMSQHIDCPTTRKVVQPLTLIAKG